LAKERDTYPPFFESYFSNFIEGREFDVGETYDIVYEGCHSPMHSASCRAMPYSAVCATKHHERRGAWTCAPAIAHATLGSQHSIA